MYKITIDASNINSSATDSLSNQKLFSIETLSSVSSYKSLSIKSLNAFTTDCVQLFIYDDHIIVLGQIDVKIYSLGGVTLQEIHFNEIEGSYSNIVAHYYANKCH